MTFYSVLSRYYEEIFPCGDSVINFLSESLDEGAAVLDAGCGTGELVRCLKQRGIEARGFDLDEGMVRTAGDILHYEASEFPGGVFRTGNLTAPGQAFPGDKFDLVSCLGNTLIHISSGQIYQFLEGANQILTPGGVLVIQILNYKNILEKSLSLSDIRTPHCIFKRRYSPDVQGESLKFNTELTNLETDEIFTHSTDHYPINPDELTALLEETGFRDIKLYGSWQKDPIADNQLPLIVQATRP